MYVTPQALIDAFGEQELVDLTDRDTPRTYEVDTAVAQRACDRAVAEIDAFVTGRYRLPLSSVPEVLRHVAGDLARYYLYDRREPPPIVQTRFDNAQKSLRAIQRGELALGADAAGGELLDTPEDLPQFVAGHKHFARGSW